MYRCLVIFDKELFPFLFKQRKFLVSSRNAPPHTKNGCVAD